MEERLEEKKNGKGKKRSVKDRYGERGVTWRHMREARKIKRVEKQREREKKEQKIKRKKGRMRRGA